MSRTLYVVCLHFCDRHYFEGSSSGALEGFVEGSDLCWDRNRVVMVLSGNGIVEVRHTGE